VNDARTSSARTSSDPADTAARLERMRTDDEHDWPTALLANIIRAPAVREADLRAATHVGQRRTEPLSGGERRALQGIAAGLTTEMTARVYGLDASTVRDQLGRARFALGAKNTCHAVALALRQGLIA
jgi:DNA-binding CsgD family transcriptional regulator